MHGLQGPQIVRCRLTLQGLALWSMFRMSITSVAVFSPSNTCIQMPTSSVQKEKTRPRGSFLISAEFG